MKIRKYITRKMLCRLVLFTAVVLSAVLFDFYHQGSDEPVGARSRRSESTTVETTPGFCVPQISTFRLITKADKLFSGLVFAGTPGNLFAVRHNFRSFHSLKAESMNRIDPFRLSAHFMKFNCCHHSGSDDSHPLA